MDGGPSSAKSKGIKTVPRSAATERNAIRGRPKSN